MTALRNLGETRDCEATHPSYVDTDALRPLLSEAQIITRVREIGDSVTRDYYDRDLILVGLMNGASAFTVDLMRSIRLPLRVGWITVSTYGMGTTAGIPKIKQDLDCDVAGKSVLIVDDILDTGATLAATTQHLLALSAASVDTCVLLRKTGVQHRPVAPTYVGFDIGCDWVAGYGIDYKDRYRNIPYLSEVLDP